MGDSGATAGMSSTSSPGLPRFRANTSRVFGRIAAQLVERAWLDETGGDAEARQRMRQQIDERYGVEATE